MKSNAKIRTVHFLIELLVKHHPSIVRLGVLLVKLTLCPLIQSFMGRRHGRPSLTGQGEAVKVTGQVLVVATGRSTPTSRHALRTSTSIT